MYKLIVADDHGIVRAGIKFILATDDRFSIIDEASSFQELLHTLENSICDALIMDLNLGDKNGISAVRQISDMYPTLSILVISMFPEDPYALQSIQSGALGYLSKKRTMQDLLAAVDIVLDGDVYLGAEYRDTLPLGIELTKNNQQSINTLSRREYEVYEMIASGLGYKDIALKLHLSPKTISTYRARIMEKLSLHGTNQLIRYSLQNSLGISK